MEKFLGAFLAKTITGQKKPASRKEKAVNGFRWQNQKQKELRDI